MGPTTNPSRDLPWSGEFIVQAVHLLVVEDEHLILLELEDALTEAGYEPTGASNGDRAIELLEKASGKFSGLITDIRLGKGSDGWEVARRARQSDPLMAIVYISADSVLDWPIKGVPNSLVLQKPFAMAQLVTAVSQLLNGSTSPAPPPELE